MTEQEKIAAIHERLQKTTDTSWTETAIATALEYGHDVRNQTLEAAAKKVKSLSRGRNCECDSCRTRANDVETILGMRL